MKAKAVKLCLLALILALTSTTSCRLSDKKKKGDEETKNVEIDLPEIEMEGSDEQAEASKNSKGLTAREVQYLNYMDDQLAKLDAAWTEFGKKMPTFTKAAIDQGDVVTELSSFTQPRAKLLDACSMVEVLPLSSVPANLKLLFDNGFVLCNQIRGLMYETMHMNATNMPADYKKLNDSFSAFLSHAKAFIDDANQGQIEKAQGYFEPVDWEAVSKQKIALEDVFNVADYGLPFGSSRAQVMGVEGIVSGYDRMDSLTYPCVVYIYEGSRTYHFNEHDQLVSYTYQLVPKDQNPYIDMMALHFPLLRAFNYKEYYFMNFASSVTLNDRGYYVWYHDERPSCTLTMTAKGNDPSQPITIEVVAKVKQEAGNKPAATQQP